MNVTQGWSPVPFVRVMGGLLTMFKYITRNNTKQDKRQLVELTEKRSLSK
jgi:hypothetical protein